MLSSLWSYDFLLTGALLLLTVLRCKSCGGSLSSFQYGVSSVHVTFSAQEEWQAMAAHGFLQRIGMQYHWKNRGYSKSVKHLGHVLLVVNITLCPKSPHRERLV